MKWHVKGNGHNRVVCAEEPWDAVATLPEMDGESGSYLSTKQDDGSWLVMHYDTQRKYYVKQTDSNTPPKEVDASAYMADDYVNWADGDPDR